MIRFETKGLRHQKCECRVETYKSKLISRSFTIKQEETLDRTYKQLYINAVSIFMYTVNVKDSCETGLYFNYD